MLAIGVLTVEGGRRGPGTAFAISRCYALTSNHLMRGAPKPRWVALTLAPKVVLRGRVEDMSEGEDVALLRLDESLPAGWEPVPLVSLGATVRRIPFWVRGYPVDRLDADAEEFDGHLVSAGVTIRGGRRALQLYSPQVAADIKPGGYSGAPVLVGLRADGLPGSSLQAAAGVVREGRPKVDAPQQMQGGTIFAAPVDAMAGAWPVLREALIESVPDDVLPYATAIENFRAQYLSRAGRRVPFGGRGDALDELNAWLAPEDGRPRMLVSAPAGQGKSALLVHWHASLGGRVGLRSILVPVSLRYELSRPEAVFRALAIRLATLHGENPALDTLEQARDAIDRYLHIAPPGDSRLVLILDGLDEASGWEAGPSLFPVDAAPGIKILVSARHVAQRSSAERWIEQLGWPRQDTSSLTLGPLTREGVRDAVASMPAPGDGLADREDILDRLHELSGGDPLVLSLYLQEIAAQEGAAAAVERLSDRPPGLDGYLDRWWEDQQRLRGQPGRDAGLIFSLLACALGPLRRREIVELARRSDILLDGERLDGALVTLDRLVVGDASAESYSVAHPRLAARRRARLEEDGDLEGFDARLREWGAEAVAALLSGDLDPKATPVYIVRHHAEHLRRDGADPNDFLDLLEAPWQAAWDAVTEEVNGFLGAADAGERAAREANAAAIERGAPPEHLHCEVLVGLARARAHDAAEMVSAEFAGELLRHGVWSGGRALALVRGRKDPYDRARTLAAVGFGLSAEQISTGEELAAGLRLEVNPAAYAQALVAVLRRLAECGRPRAALERLQTQPPGPARGLALVGLLKALPPKMRAEAVALSFEDVVAVRGEDIDDLDGIEFLRRLADSVAVELVQQMWTGADMQGNPERAACALIASHRSLHTGPAVCLVEAQEGREGDLNFDELALVWPWLTAERRQTQLDRMLGEIERAIRRGSPGWELEFHYFAEALARRMDAAALGRVLALLEDLDDVERHWQVYMELLPQLGSAALTAGLPVVDLVLEAVAIGGSAGERAVSAAARAGFGELVLETVKGLSDSIWEKADLLAVVAPFLAEAQTRWALAECGRIRPDRRRDVERALLARLASFGPAQAREALALAAAAADPDKLAAATAVLAPDIQARSALAVEDLELRLATLMAAAPWIQVDGAALEACVRSFGKDPAAVEAFDWLHPRLVPGQLTAPEVLAALEHIIRRVGHGRKDKPVMAYLRAVCREVGAERAFAIARDMNSQLPLAWAAIAIADELGSETARDYATLAQDAVEDEALKAAVRAALLADIPAQDSAQERAAIVEVAAHTVQIQPTSIVLLEHLSPEDRRQALAQTPEEFFDRHGAFAMYATWAGHMAGLMPAFDRDHIERIRRSAQNGRETGPRDELFCSIATRLAQLGDVDDALSQLRLISDRNIRGVALRDMARWLPDASLARWVEQLLFVEVDYWQGSRALAWGAASEWLAGLSPPQLWDAWLRWPLAEATAGAILVDLLGYASVVRSLGSPQTLSALADHFVPSQVAEQ